MRIAYPLAGLICLLFLSACGSVQKGNKKPKQLTEESYLKWYESADYPYRDTVEVNQIVYVCTFEPRQVEIVRQYTSQLITRDEMITYLKEEDDLLQFQIRIFLPQAGTDVIHYKLKEGESVNSRTSYFAFGIKSDLKIDYEASGTTDCLSVHFERGIANLPTSKVLAYFPFRQEKIKSITFDAAVFGQSKISFDLNELSINTLPRLKL